MNLDIFNEYKNDLNSFLRNTIYNPEILYTNEFEKKMLSPFYGIKYNKGCFENDSSKVSKALLSAYAVNKYDLEIINSKRFNFFKRPVASGGALYPNNIYYCPDGINFYQFNPLCGTYNLLAKFNNKKANLNNIFIITSCYFKNWIKYSYFGYRLSLVDTGHLVGSLSTSLGIFGIKHQICIESDLFDDVKKDIKQIITDEPIQTVIKLPSNIFCKPTNKLKNMHIKENISTKTIPLYSLIDEQSCNEKIHYSCSISDLSEYKNLNQYKFYRYSPGGGLLTVKKDNCKYFYDKSIVKLKRMLKNYSTLLDDMHIYIISKAYNEIKGPMKYEVELEKNNLFKFSEKISMDNFNQIMRKHNINIEETQALIFLGTDMNFKSDDFNVSEFKLEQLKIGLIAQLITVAFGENHCICHPVLGFNSEKAEKLLNLQNKSLLHLMCVSQVDGAIPPLLYFMGN
ncbi:hypothetical protein LGVB_01550 (plasmid) [Lactobacillus gasseri]|uniref:SagB-type dehydrogenase domain protein n=1 Tax=Lactobacillus paragasseri JV-V03 TaxID=525326 RepID=A0AA87AL04_9LACO|nr:MULTISPECIES: hypothetical protein [Lactobacillus]EFJ68967.1 hypothetical protein HMPREF0514_11734 [Lactobacillus paragasseri JV-V03]MBS7524947.1 hypothetical protein [Lactobacillus gasseri]MCZ3590932.1 hypothetical protein [Lactobacillus gasseri]UWI44382.1 hypothetical protein HR119_09310 [Lactobacillus paragasseri]UWI46127.1 hypothetical protein HR117_09200 [Lactobacillus paragasseri]